MYAQKSKKHTVLDPFCGGHLNFIAGRSPSAWPRLSPLAWITAGQGHRFLEFAGSKCQKHVAFGPLDCDFWIFRPAGTPRPGPVSATGLEHGKPRSESLNFGLLKSTKTRCFEPISLRIFEKSSPRAPPRQPTRLVIQPRRHPQAAHTTGNPAQEPATGSPHDW